MQWFYTVLLIMVSAATVGYGGYLLRRLFTSQPVPAAAGPVEDPTGGADAS